MAKPERLKIENLKLPPEAPLSRLTALAAKALRLPERQVRDLTVLRRSVDAREEVRLVYTVAVTAEGGAVALGRRGVSRYEPPEAYRVPAASGPWPEPPVVVGAGPAGLFCTLVLAMAGLRPVLLERGRPTERRQTDVERFWSTGVLDEASNVQFGEGGAGAFSDGKLNTGTRDPRHRFILERFVEYGAPEDILIDAKPHIGTDRLHTALVNFRRALTALGADIRFESRAADLLLENGAVAGVAVEGPQGAYVLPCRRLALALGHSARDTVETLYRRGVAMEAKPFAVGVRIEHRQADIDLAQYRKYVGHPGLPAASYKLSCHLPDGRAAYSFCVCPGGTVVAAASERERLVTNGMSVFARDGENINGGFLVNVTPEDFGGEGPLAGIAFQRRLEAAAFALGGGGYRAPCQRVEDFLVSRPSAAWGRVRPSYRPGVVMTDLRRCLPRFVADALAEALPILGQKLRGFDHPDALLTAVESRSSSPVRLPRDEAYQSVNVPGLYPCGEGAGYAGGILSAAADGMRTAERMIAGT